EELLPGFCFINGQCIADGADVPGFDATCARCDANLDPYTPQFQNTLPCGNGCGFCDRSGTCQPDDYVCGWCQRCNRLGLRCEPQDRGQDLKNQCVPSAACGGTGDCNGGGDCEYDPQRTGQTCAPGRTCQ